MAENNNYYQLRESKLNKNSFSIAQERLEYIIFDYLNFDKQGKYKILELGSGIGNSLFFLAGKYPNIQFTGIEINKKEVEFCKSKINNENITNINIIEGDATIHSIDERFDFVFSEQVIEHIQNQIGLIKNLIKHLDEKGTFFLSTTSYNFPYEFHIGIPFITRLSKKNAIKFLKIIKQNRKANYYENIYPINNQKIINYIKELNFDGKYNNISKLLPVNKFSKKCIIIKILNIIKYICPKKLYNNFFPWIGIIGTKN